MHTDHDVLETAEGWRRGGAGVALATVVRTWGSAPRPAGSHMAIRDSGDFEGSVSGGCVETAVVDEALDVIRTGAAIDLEYGVTDEMAWEVGLACGGRVAIRVERLEEGALAALLRALEEKRPVVTATRLDDGERTLLAPLGASDAESASWPVPEAARALRDDRASVVDTAAGPVFLRPYNPPVRLVVVGAVHIAAPLARMARTAGIDVVIVDPRTAFASPERFPGVRLVDAWPEEALARLAPDHRTAVVTLTHDAKLDDPALRAALAGPAFYVGALGSTRTHARRLERLREAGVDDDALGRIRAPVGLDIGARTPAEIAVAILAEIVAQLRVPPAA